MIEQHNTAIHLSTHWQAIRWTGYSCHLVGVECQVMEMPEYEIYSGLVVGPGAMPPVAAQLQQSLGYNGQSRAVGLLLLPSVLLWYALDLLFPGRVNLRASRSCLAACILSVGCHSQ